MQSFRYGCHWPRSAVVPNAHESETDVMQMEAVLVEDEESVRMATAQTLEIGGFNVRTFTNAEDAQQFLAADFSGILITDVRLPGKTGLDLLAHTVALDPDLPVLVMTGHGYVAMAVEAMRMGAYDFVEKPFSAVRLLEAALRAQEKRRLVMENRALKSRWVLNPDLPALIGQSLVMERLRQTIQSLGTTDVDVLINGKTGTGKEVVARHLHASSGRKGPFVALNCGALPETVFESEIFGYEPGAFTGAQKRKLGKLEFASGGTVFLDEIESMPLALQVKLLRVLQERRLERLGGNETIKLDCRIIAATKVNLLDLSAKGQFREDLYYRVSVVSLDLPTLAQRPDDIPLLLNYFVQVAAERFKRQVPQLDAPQLLEYQQRAWRGNVRELRNFADRLVLGLEGALPEGDPAATFSLPLRVDAYEASLIKSALDTHGGNVALAAEQLGIPKKTLYDKMKKSIRNRSERDGFA